MTSEYTTEQLLPLSGIQHFSFCRRQWALIHVERQWQENVLTMDGRIMHNRADDPYFSETRNGVIIARSMPVASYQLGFYGICDVVEFHPAPEGVPLFGRKGTYLPMPVEYKRGAEKEADCDRLQLCAQVICLEEMLSTKIVNAFLFYGKTRRRVSVDLSQTLRDSVYVMAREMHAYFERGHTPRVKVTRACSACSLKETCLPKMQKQERSVSTYIRNHLEESE